MKPIEKLLGKVPASKLPMVLWTAFGSTAFGLLFVRVVLPEMLWLTITVGVLFLCAASLLVIQNQRALKTRQAAFGINSIVTSILVISIVGVVNFLASRYPGKLDLTKNKLHTLSDQTEKLIKGLKQPVRAVLFQKASAREQSKTFLDSLKGMNPKFEVEYVDPDKEPSRARQANVRKYGTLQIFVGERDTKVEEVTEEKVTNALMKLMKEKATTLCVITGHGEKSFSSTEADGFENAKKTLANQSYEVKDLNLAVEGKIGPDCSAIAVIGPTKAFFDKEIVALKDYLNNGGRAIFALDIDVKGGEFAGELQALLRDWHIRVDKALVIDPVSRVFNVEATVPMVMTYSKDHVITKELQTQTLFPFSRPLDVIEGAPAGMNVQWLAKSNPQSWAEADLKQLASGKAQRDPSDKGGPITVAVSVEGKQKDSKATRATRIVAFGSALFASNNYSRFGANIDLFANAVSWILEDENLISIRSKEDGPGSIQLSQRTGSIVLLFTLIVMPLSIFIAGIVVWFIRKKL